jgi:hypothetical protein
MWFDLYFDLLRLGTLAPDFRASDSPIAIACLRLVTFFPDRPLLSVPCFRSCIARSTFLDAFSPYFGIGYPFKNIGGPLPGISARERPAMERDVY